MPDRDIGDNWTIHFHDMGGYGKCTSKAHGGFWSIDAASEHCLYWCNFSVRVFNFPLFSMTLEAGDWIGKALGTLHDMDIPADGIAWGQFMQIQIGLDVTKPLAPSWGEEFLFGFYSVGQHGYLPTFGYVWLSWI